MCETGNSIILYLLFPIARANESGREPETSSSIRALSDITAGQIWNVQKSGLRFRLRTVARPKKKKWKIRMHSCGDIDNETQFRTPAEGVEAVEVL